MALVSGICSNCGKPFKMIDSLKGRHWLCKSCEEKKLAGAKILNQPREIKNKPVKKVIKKEVSE
jgi:ribosomal protein L37AE/L43A